MSDLSGLLDDLEAAARAVGQLVIDEVDWAEAAHRLRSVEVAAAEKRREVEEDATGWAEDRRKRSLPVPPFKSDYGNLAEKTSRQWSFNESGLLAAAAAVSGDNLTSTIRDLRRRNAVRLNWLITGVRAFAEANDMPLTIAHHEIEDGDPNHHVGQVTVRRMVRTAERPF